MLCLLLSGGEAARAQTAITLQDAMNGAKRYSGQVQAAALAERLAHEDTAQTKASMLPSLNGFNQFIYTQGNGTPSGVYVANDGVHVYSEQLQLHQDLFSGLRRAEYRRSKAAEAVATARRDVTLRGLQTTVAQDFYAVVTAVRKVANAESSLRDADTFVDITQKQERGGEAARADVIKAQLQQQQRQRDLSDAKVALEKAKVTLAVMIFPDVTRDFTAVDDMENAPTLDAMPAVKSQAIAASPDVRVAQESIRIAREEVSVARYAYLPGLTMDFFYGINANQFAGTTDYPTPESGRSTLPNYLVTGRQNLGYSGQATLNIPLWNWGATRSKVKQAEIRREQAQTDVTLAERQLRANISLSYLEAQAAQEQIESLRRGVDLSVESLRLTLLRYQAGESAALEVVDAQSTLALARNAYADGLARYRVALANLQTLTGHF